MSAGGPSANRTRGGAGGVEDSRALTSAGALLAGALLALGPLLCACHERAAPAAQDPAAEASSRSPASQPEPASDEVDRDQDGPATATQPVDDMDEAALEAACFEGRGEACDRLGH